MNTTDNVNTIINFIETAQFKNYVFDESHIILVQSEDQKRIKFNFNDIEKVLERVDYDGSLFLQINFYNKTKILITKALVGFKPLEIVGFDSTKIPKVVTTVDLSSVKKAIEDLYEVEESYQTATEIDVLKKVYQSIMLGAEGVGFEIKAEKHWFGAFMLNQSAATA